MPILGTSASRSGGTPTAPTSVSATAGNGQATVTFTASSYIGKGSVTYTAISSPGNFTATGTSPITVTGLTNGTAYTFTVRATSSTGETATSSASSSVTPVAPEFMARVYQSNSNQISAQKLHVDSSGNIYQVGNLLGSSPNSERYGYLAKFNAAGAIQWQKQFAYYAVAQNRRTATASSVTTDSSGNVYVVGTDMPSDSYYDYQHPQVYKFDSSGNLLWQKRYDNQPDPGGTPRYFQPYNTVIDSSSNIYFTSGIEGSTSTTTNQDFGLTKLDSSGNHSFTNYYTYSGDSGSGNVFNGVVLDSSTNILAVGYYPTYTKISKFETITHQSWVVAKANSSGTLSWVRKFYNYGKLSYAMGAGIDSSDNVYSSGYSDVSGFRNAYVVKHDSSGALQWQRRLQGSGGGDLFGNLCAVDTSGNVYVLCYDVNAPGYLIIAKWDSSGTIQWQRSLVINNIFTSSADIKVSGNTIIVTGNYSQASILYNSSYVIKVPTDGSKTGTYTVGGHTYTYSAANNSETYGSMSEASDSLTLNVASISTSTTSATVESSSLVAAVTNI